MLNESAPVFNIDLNRGFRIWYIDEIYQVGQEDTDGVNNFGIFLATLSLTSTTWLSIGLEVFFE